MVEKHHVKGVKLYTAEWKGESRGYKMSDPWAYRYLEHAEKLGIKQHPHPQGADHHPAGPRRL